MNKCSVFVFIIIIIKNCLVLSLGGFLFTMLKLITLGTYMSSRGESLLMDKGEVAASLMREKASKIIRKNNEEQKIFHRKPELGSGKAIRLRLKLSGFKKLLEIFRCEPSGENICVSTERDQRPK